MFLISSYSFSKGTLTTEEVTRMNGGDLHKNEHAISATPKVFEDDPVMRNYYITKGYYNLSREMNLFLKTKSKIVNWFTVGAFASNSVGKVINGETSNYWKQRIHNDFPVIHFITPVYNSVFNYFTYRSAEAMAEGNLDIAMNIFPLFKIFLEVFGEDEEFSQSKYDDFNRWYEENYNLRNKDQLEKALNLLYRARFEQDGGRKSQMIYASTLLMVVSEQMNVQDDIEKSVPFGARTIVTQFFSKLVIGEKEYQLGNDIESAKLPNELFRPQIEELKHLYEEYEINFGSKEHRAGVLDWSQFNERIRYISYLFAANHRNKYLMNVRPSMLK